MLCYLHLSLMISTAEVYCTPNLEILSCTFCIDHHDTICQPAIMKIQKLYLQSRVTEDHDYNAIKQPSIDFNEFKVYNSQFLGTQALLSALLTYDTSHHCAQKQQCCS